MFSDGVFPIQMLMSVFGYVLVLFCKHPLPPVSIISVNLLQ